MTALIIEDEAPARARLKRLLADEPTIQLIGEASSIAEAHDLIEAHKPDVLFLDIQLRDENAFQLLADLREVPFIIFTTAYSEYAVAAFEQNAVDYLLKPIEAARLQQAISKLETRSAQKPALNLELMTQLLAELNRPRSMTSLSVKSGDRYIFVRLSTITHFEAKDKYVTAFTYLGKSYLLDQSLKTLLEKLPSYFVQVHRGYVVNRELILEIQKYFGGRFLLTLGSEQSRAGCVQITSGAHFAEVVQAML